MSSANTRRSPDCSSTCSLGSARVCCLTICIASATEIIFCALLFVPFCGPKTERPVLDRPLKVGGGIQPRLVTVLTPATTFTVENDFIQKVRAVNSTSIGFSLFCYLSIKMPDTWQGTPAFWCDGDHKTTFSWEC